ncbi:MAG: ABC transporter permease [Carboxylicivirga sp.]|nr:ABC transporter permease [Carboxylicivirga sp.]
MIRYYLKTAYRNLIKDKLNTTLNILGFSIALTIVVLISIYAHKELSANQFHKDAESIYKISGWGTPNALAPFLEQRIPEIKAICRICGGDQWATRIQKEDKTMIDVKGIIYTDNSFFDVFTFPLLIPDNHKDLLTAPYCLVVTETFARRFFETTEVAGKTIDFQGRLFTIKGVVKDPPHNSSLQFTVLISLSTWEKQRGQALKDSWGNFSYETFAKFQSPVNKKELQSKIQETIRAEGNLQYEIEHVKLYTLKDLYFNSSLYSQFRRGNKKNVNSMIWIGIITLVLAIVNFFNLSTSQGITRSQEIGVRKVNGSSRMELIKQFLAEAFVISFISIFFALLLTNLVLPWFNELTISRFDSIYMQDWRHWLALISGSLLLTLLAGAYPALYLSAFKPVEVIKSEKHNSFFRQTLIVFQFIVSIVLIIATLFISKQLNYLKTKDLGFEKESIFCVQLNQSIFKNYSTFSTRLKENPAILSISQTSGYLGNNDAGFRLKTLYNGEEREIWCKRFIADTSFLRTFDLSLVDQRMYNKNRPHVFLNEEAIKQLQADSPFMLEVEQNNSYTELAGVVENFHFKSLKHGIEPLAVYINPNMWGIINIRFNPKSFQSVNELVEFCREIYADLSPNEEYQYDFLDDVLARSYDTERRFRLMVSIFSAFSIFISCLGLLGMIIFSNSRRTKEIGVRKVLGAESMSVMQMLIRDYSKWLLLSFVLGVPIAFYIMQKWLNTFPFRTTLSWWIFALAGLLVFAIASLTIVIQSLRTVNRNPVDSLRYE